MFSRQDNIEYWGARARIKDGWETASNDPILRQLELDLMTRVLVQHSSPPAVIIDLGCEVSLSSYES